MPKTIVVTGASGFIGKHVLNELLTRGHSVIAITRSAYLLQSFVPAIKIIELDIAKPFPELMNQLEDADALIHLAWGGLPNYNSCRHFEYELPIHYHFIKSLVMERMANIVVAGTCLEYGQQCGALSEDSITFPCTPYGLAKDTLRKQLQFLQEEYNFCFSWARLFYVFGPGQSQNSLWSQLNRAVAEGREYFDTSLGEQLRDYLPVELVAKQLVALALNGEDNGIVNICSGNPVSVRSLIEKWIVENKWEIKLQRGVYSYPPYEPLAFWGDNKKNLSILEK